MSSRTLSPLSTVTGAGSGVGSNERGAPLRLGKYEIIKRLAKGGMAEIDLAQVCGTVPGFRKVVVIKRILPELVKQPAFVSMFFDEARLAATLQHPNIVQVFDVGEADGQFYMAMEYLHGEDVRSIMRAAQNRIPIEHALHIALGLCAGLHYAHEKVGFDGEPLNIVHRDISPQNVIVTFDGAVKLLDFGIAKAANQDTETRIGELKGKVPYMSPEQCTGAPLDRRTDIFSLGIFLYEITVGRRLYGGPHGGRSDYDVMKEIVDGRVTPPREIDPLYHPTLEAIVMRALEKDPDKRFQTVREMQSEIDSLARKSHLYVSPTGLEEYMTQLFGTKIEAWREAQAQGKSLIEHLETLLFEVPTRTPVPAPREIRETREARATRENKEEARPSKREPTSELRRESSDTRNRLETPYELPAFRIDEPAAAVPPRLPPRALPSVTVADEVSQTAIARAPSTPAPRQPTLRPQRRTYMAPRPRLLRIGLIAIPILAIAMLAGAYGHSRWRNLHSKTTVASIVSIPSIAAPEPRNTPRPVEYGIIKVDTDPPKATLYLDGKKLDKTTPATVDRIEVGRPHVLLVQLEGRDDFVEQFTLEPGGVLPLSIALEPSHRLRQQPAPLSSIGHHKKPKPKKHSRLALHSRH